MGWTIRISCLALLVSTYLGASEEIVVPRPEDWSAIPPLDCQKTYRGSGRISPPVDIRWASDDSVFLLYPFGGVIERDLREGLPQRRTALPSGARIGGRTAGKVPFFILASSSDFLMESNGAISAWRKANSDREFGVQLKKRGGFSDADLDGDKMVILGFPGPEWSESNGEIVWSYKLTENDMEDMQPLFRTAGPVYRRMGKFWRVYAGSIRILPDGGVLFVTGYSPEAYLLSSSGRLEKLWDLRSLGMLDKKEAEELLLKPTTSKPDASWEEREAGILAWNETVIIDEVLSLGKEPALIVRFAKETKPHWYLLVLGAVEPSWYRIPIEKADRGARLKVDSDRKGRLAILLGDRGYRMEPRDDGEEKVLICKEPV